MSDIATKLKKGQNLSLEDSKSLFSDLMEGKHAEDQIIEILEALIKKGETKDELAGGIFILRDKATKVSSDPNGIIWIRYKKAQKNQYISASSVFDGKFEESKFKDKYVLIGASAQGLFDLVKTRIY